MDPSEIGKYGTLRLMKRLEPDTVVASFPIDDETVTFGRDPQCSVRLYYPKVSSIHAKLVFQERKAFVVILGTNGLSIDGCPVFPSDDPDLPTTVPVSNNSEIEIHKKRFIFTYPPKELRAALFDSPVRNGPTTPGARRRALRMSMIQSAEVFSPRPSRDPNENLKILQSPLKTRGRSPVKHPLHQQQNLACHRSDMEEEEIILVDGNNPRVMEEEKDLVILESVEVNDNSIASLKPEVSTRKVNFLPANNASISSQLQTPHRRVQGRPSLHRAVLIRSAQRAIMKMEIEKEEEEEEKEVEDFIAQSRELEDKNEFGMADVQEQMDGEGPEDDISDEDYDEESTSQPEYQSGGWRKSLEAVKGLAWPFSSSSAIQEDNTQWLDDCNSGDGEDPIEVHEPIFADVRMQEEERQAPLPALTATPARTQQLNHFLTPQPHYSQAPEVNRGAGRYSFGGAQRVRLEPKWKVTDIIVPLPKEKVEGTSCLNDNRYGQSEETWGSKRSKISDEERKAIRERRKSALTTPDPIFGGQVPGFSARLLSSPSPAAVSSFFSPERKSMSPMKAVREADSSEGDDEEDTRSLLDRMKKTVEDMKRRRSIGPPSNVDSAHDEDVALDASENHDYGTTGQVVTSRCRPSQGAGEEGSDKENDSAISLEHDYSDQRFDSRGQRSVDDDPDTENAGKKQENDTMGAFSGASLHSPEGRDGATPLTPPLDTLKHLFPLPKTGSSTPAFSGVRDLFKNADAHRYARLPQTAWMDGVRDMYLREGTYITDTPTFEGLGDMMETPVGYHRFDQEDHDGRHGEEDPDVNEVSARTARAGRMARFDALAEAHVMADMAQLTTTTSAGNAVAGTVVSNSGQKLLRPAPLELVEERPTQPPPSITTEVEEVEVSGAIAQPNAGEEQNLRTKPRLLRGRKQVVGNDERDKYEVQSIDTPTGVPARSSRIKNVKKEDKLSILPEVTKTRSAARRKATPKHIANLDLRVTNNEPAKPLCRTRLATKETSSSQSITSVDEEPPASAKPTRRGKPTKKAGELEDAELPVRALPKGRSRSKALNVAEDNGVDPSDSICQTGDKIANVEHFTQIAKSTRIAVKQEYDEGASEGKSMRGAARAVVKAAPSANNSRLKATSAKKVTSITVSKLTATPSCVPDNPENGINKENTPSADEEDPIITPARIPSTTRSSKVKLATVSTKIRGGEIEVDTTAKTRATRTTRTRR